MTQPDPLGNICWSQTLQQGVDSADLVIEAISESLEEKACLFEELDKLSKADAIITSNTSSISISKLESCTTVPRQVGGLHFFNPVHIMKPVEVVSGFHTTEETLKTLKEFVHSIGKEPFLVKDSPGFAVNRILLPLINEAIHTLEEGIADAGTIDSLMKLGCNHPVGPLKLADFVGLDVCLSILNHLKEGLDDPKFSPAALLSKMVSEGKLGRKTGEGFYKYGKKESL